MSEFLNERKQRVHLECMVSESDVVVCGITQVNVLGPSLFLLYTPRTSPLLGTILWARRMILQSEQLFIERFRVLKDEIAESGFVSNRFLGLEVAHNAQH